MAYDEDLAHRVRELLADECGLSEQAMFGGLAFLLDGNMADERNIDRIVRGEKVGTLVSGAPAA